jgi:hypothetical protein
MICLGIMAVILGLCVLAVAAARLSSGLSQREERP